MSRIKIEQLKSGYKTAVVEHDWRAAVQFLDELLALAPSADCYCRRGMVYAKMERFSLAVEDFHKALDLEPGHRRARELHQRFMPYAENETHSEEISACHGDLEEE